MEKLNELIEIANKEYDGHFSLLKFTTNWRCCFGTIDQTIVATSWMAEGKTMDEAIEKCIKDRTNAFDKEVF